MIVPGVFLRRARIRGLREGQIQRGRVEATENDVKDDAERMQDYGLATNPVDGQGLVMTVGGHTIIVRMDRLAERPQLAAYEVAVWHKEGHMIKLREGKLIEVSCDTFKVNAAVKVEFNTPTVAMSAKATVGTTLGVTGRTTTGLLTSAGKNLDNHTHPDITSGGNTGPNN